MAGILINACVRKQSRTAYLTRYFLSKWNEEITEILPLQEGISGLDEQTLGIRDKALAGRDYGHPVLKYAVQFSEADTVIIAAPFWDLSFPAQLKNYIERVNAVGVTFDYDEKGIPFGLCRAKRLIYITTAGGKIENDIYGYGYVKQLCESFWKIPETVCFAAEELDMPYADPETILNNTKKQMDLYLEQIGHAGN